MTKQEISQCEPIFLFLNVFKSSLLQRHQKASVCGNWLNLLIMPMTFMPLHQTLIQNIVGKKRIQFFLILQFKVRSFHCSRLWRCHISWTVKPTKLQSRQFPCVFISSNVLLSLTLCIMQMHFDTSTAITFWKYFRERRNCTSLAISSFATMLSSLNVFNSN